MPSGSTFAQLGLFVRERFLDATCCTHLIEEMVRARAEKGRLVRDGVDHVLDETARRVSSARVAPSTRSMVRERFTELLPQLRSHFATELSECEPPGFLIYGPGAFFAPHTDAGSRDPSDIRRRRISTIVFLNAPTASPAADGFAGGTLRFHGMLDGPAWAACPLPFDAERGMLVAFRSDLVHEVTPVTAGQRFSVVTWFLAPGSVDAEP